MAVEKISIGVPFDIKFIVTLSILTMESVYLLSLVKV
jgi:hypothetical protein